MGGIRRLFGGYIGIRKDLLGMSIRTCTGLFLMCRVECSQGSDYGHFKRCHAYAGNCHSSMQANFTPPPPPYLPAPNARSSECAAYSSVLVVVDVVEVNVIMGAGMDSLIVDVIERNVIMGAGMHSLVSCFAVNNSNLAVVGVFIRML